MTKLTTIALTLTTLAATAFADKAPTPPKDAKVDAKKMEPPKVEPPKAPAAPAELAEMAKGMAGTWTCTGQMMSGPGQMGDAKSTFTSKLDADKFWIVTNLASTMGKMKYTFVGYTTYDATSKKWYRTMMDNMGGFGSEESTGLAGNKVVWEGQGHHMGMTMKSRDTDEMVSPKEVHMVGESTMDGKTWNKVYDQTCKK